MTHLHSPLELWYRVAHSFTMAQAPRYTLGGIFGSYLMLLEAIGELSLSVLIGSRVSEHPSARGVRVFFGAVVAGLVAGVVFRFLFPLPVALPTPGHTDADGLGVIGCAFAAAGMNIMFTGVLALIRMGLEDVK